MTDTPNFVTTDLAWLKNHVIALVLAAGMAGGAVYGFSVLQEKHDAAIEARDDAKLAAATAQTAQAQQTLVTVQQQLLVMVQQLQAQNAQLEKAKFARDSQTATQVKNDSTLSAQQTAERLANQLQAQPTEIQATAGDIINMSLPAARRVTADLDLLVSSQADLQDTTTQLNNETELVIKSKEVNDDQATVIVDLTNQNKAQVADCKAQVSTLKANNRKSKIKTFFIGFGLGFIAGATVHVW